MKTNWTTANSSFWLTAFSPPFPVFAFLITCCLSATASFAIGLSGTYTIGGASPDYNSFASAVNDLTVQGVSGPVVFSVRNGTYTEQITIPPVTGVSATNTITFESESGDSTAVVLTYASNSFLEPWTLRLYDADYIIFRKMTIEATGANYAQAVRITENAQHNSFLSNILKGAATSSTNYELAVVFCGIGDNHNSTFRHNRFLDGSYGLYFSGNFIIIENFSKNNFEINYSEKIVLENNTFYNQYYQGIYLDLVQGASIQNNSITSNTNVFSYTGIVINSSIDSTKIIANRITDIGENGAGIALQGVQANAQAPALVANNFVEISGMNSNQGIFCQGGLHVSFLFNTVRVLDNNTNGAFFLQSSDSTIVRNNIFSNTGGGFAFNLNGSNTCTSDFNNIYSSGPFIGWWNGMPASNLSEWQTITSNQDTSSYSVDPQFEDPGVFLPRAIELNNAGTPEPAVTLDFAGVTRHAQNPDIGALEFTPDSLDAAITGFSTPVPPASPGLTVVRIHLKNNGLNTLTSVLINLKVNNDSPVQTNWSGSLPSGDTTTVILDTIDLASGNSYDLIAWTVLPNGSTDPNADNDTAKILGLLPALSGVYTIGGSMPDFPTFTGAVNTLMQAGVVGPVWFNVRNGTYTEKIAIGPIPGADSTRQVVFQSESGDSSLVVLAFSSMDFNAPWTLLLNGANWLTFKKMTIEATGTSFAQAVQVTQNARNNNFLNNILRSTSAPSLSVSRTVVYCIAGNNLKNVFRKNRIANGSTGLWFEGDFNEGNFTPGLEADSNQFVNQYHQAMNISSANSPKIRYNTISSTSTYPSFTGIALFSCAGPTTILANRINNITTDAFGIKLEYLNAPPGNPTIVANNFVETTGSGAGKGIFIAFNEHVQVLHNTVRVLNSNTAGRALDIPDNLGIAIRNNNLVNMGGGYAIHHASATLDTSDYNNLYSTGSRIGHWNGTDAPSLTIWRSLSANPDSLDTHSISVDPQIQGVSAYLPHAIQLNGAALPISALPLDLNGVMRDSQFPDIGAAEFTPDSTDAAVVAFLNLSMPVAAGSTPIRIRLQNNGLSTLTATQVYLKVNNDAPVFINWTGSLASGDSTTVLLDTIDLVSGTSYNLLAWSAMPNGAPDPYPANDTTKVLNLWPALSGVYTIGGAMPSFPTFSAAVVALLQAGVSGPVTFNVRPGLYLEQLVFGPIIGADSSRQVIFQSESGDSTSVTLRFTASSPANYTVRLNGTQWITFRKMTLESISGSFGRIVALENGAGNVTLSNNVLLGASGASITTSRALVFASGVQPSNNIRITNNRIMNGSYGFYYSANFMNHATGTYLANNTLIGQSGQSIVLLYNSDVVVESNTISKPIYSTSFTGISVTEANQSPRITGNKLSTTSDGYGIYLQNISGITDTMPALVANNYVQLGSGASIDFGIYLSNGQHAKILYNTVRINGTNTNSSALYLATTPDNAALNNILHNTGGGYALRFSAVPNANDLTTDYNDLFAGGPTLVYTGASYPTLLDWKNSGLGFDEHSLETDPLFYGPNGYQVAQTDLNGAGTPSTFVTTDIEGDVRDAQNPDIGADEFNLAPADAGVFTLVVPVAPFPSGTQLVQAMLKNHGADPLTSVDIEWTINGMAQTPVSWTGSLASGATQLVDLDSLDFVIGQLISLKVWTANPNMLTDPVHANDTSSANNLHPALIGLYTIGGGGPDFSTFSLAAAALQNGGILGAVTFDVRNGTYSEQLSFPQILGASPINTITFQSESEDSTAVTLQFNGTSGQNYVVQLNGGDWFRFRNMTLKALNSTNARVVTILGGSDNNIFENNRLQGVATSSTSDTRAIAYSPSGTTDHGNIFRENHFSDGSDGVFLFGTFGVNTFENDTRIENNKFENQYRRAINLIYQNAPIVVGNILVSNTTYTSLNGIVLFFCNSDLRVLNNKLTLEKAIVGIAIDNCLSTAENPGLIANNFVQIGGTLLAEGIWFNSSNYQNAYFNSIHINSSHTSSRAFALNSGGNLRLFNNIGYNSTNGYVLQRNSTANIAASDHNDFFTTGSDLIFNSNFSTTFANLADWQTATGFDSNSISVNPIFASDTNLHTTNVLLDGLALPFTEVPADIDGQVRNTTMPDIGADEFPIAQNDAGILSITFPKKIFGAGSQPVQVTLFNNGLDTLETATIEWTVNGVPQPPYDWTGNLLSGGQVDSLSIGNFIFDIGTAYSIEAWATEPNGQTDGDASNDTARVQNLYAALGGVYTIGGTTPDFPDFNSAVQAMNLGGVIGAVVFNVRNGTYPEQVTLKEVAGMSIDETVTFQSESGDSTAVILTFSSISNGQNFTLRLDSADYFRFKKMTIQATGVSFNRTIHLLHGARHNIFENNVLIGGNGYEVVHGEDLSNPNHGNAFHRNRFQGGTQGIGLSGPFERETGTIISDNTFLEQTQRGIFLYRQHGAIVSGNTVTRTSGAYETGIYLYACANTFQVVKNKIDVPLYFGIYLNGCENTIGNEGIVANNFVSVGNNGANFVRGIALESSPRNKIIFNNVHIRDQYYLSQAFGNSYSNNIITRNNVWANSGGGYAVVSANSVNLTSDYNDLFSTGSPLALWNGTDATNLADWQTLTNQDAQSISIDPGFSSDTDLHVSEVDLDKAGTPVAGIPDDIDGESRNPQTPDIGADEFLPIRTNDVGIVELISPNKVQPFAAGNQPMIVVLKNNGVDTITSATIRWRMNNNAQTPFAWAGFLTAGERDTVQIGAFNFPIGFGHLLLVYSENPNGQPDENPENDSLWVSDLYAGLSGTYTLGGVLPDFGSFTQAATTLNKGGVLGTVIFNVRNGIYTEQISIENIRGSSAANTITFQSENADSSAVALKFGSGNYVCRLDGTSYLTLKQMTIENTSNIFNSATIQLQGSAFNNTFVGNRILGTSNNYILFSANAHLSLENNLVLQNNTFQGGLVGITINGINSANLGAGLLIDGNTFSGQNNAISIAYQDNPTVQKNTIAVSGDAIALHNCHSAQVVQNKISSTDGSGIALNSCTGDVADRTLVANNFVHLAGTGTRYGISTYYGDHQNFYYNSVNCTSTHPNSSAFSQYYGSSKYLRNNVFANPGGGYAMYVSNGSGLAVSDFNDLYSTGPNLGYWDGAFAANLSALQTAGGKEDNSVSVDPLFYSDTDLHILQAQLDSAAIPVAEVTKDIDGSVRDANSPDIGADEIDFLAEDVGITILIAPVNSCTLGSAETVTVRIQNYSSVPLTGFDVAYSIDGGTPVVENIGGLNIPPGNAANYAFATTANFAFVGSYELVAYSLLPDDTDAGNDTLSVLVTHVQTPVAVSNMIPTDGAAGLSKTIAFSWSPSPGATLYDLYIWPEADPQPGAPTVANISQINFVFYNLGNILQFGQAYRWRIVAKNPNCSANGPIQIFTLANLPDLVVNAITVPSGAFSGQQVNIAWEIKNMASGSTGMGQWTDVVYLSSDTVLDINIDLYLGGVPNFSALDSGQVYANSANFTLPEGITGHYYFFVFADRYNYLQETDEANNVGVSASAVNIQLTPPPDLQITTIVPPNNPFSGLPATFNWTVENLGTGETRSSGWTDRTYLSPDAGGLNIANATWLGDRTFTGSLDVNDTYEKTITVNLPQGISGTYYLYVVTDFYNQEYEHANEGNNTTRSTAFTVFLTPPPDLQVTAVTAPASGSNLESKTISYIVSNEGGNNATGSWVDRLYGSTDSALVNLASATLLATASRPAELAPTETYNHSFNVTLPDGITGAYYFYVWTDAANAVYEYTFENNNTLRAAAVLLLTPDLAVQNISAPAAAESGDTMTVIWTDQNIGTGKVVNRSWTDRIYISQNSAFSLPASTLVGSLNATATVDTSAGLARSKQIVLPQGISGSYYWFVWTDAAAQMYENGSDANNINATGIPLTVSLAPYPDLHPTGINAPSSAAAGTAVSVTYTVENIGTRVANPSWRDKIYLSPSIVWNPNAAQLLRTETVEQTLEPDSTYLRAATVVIPLDAPGGIYYLFVFADQENNVYEFTGENNNLLASGGITVTGYPPVDLDVTVFSGPSSVPSGATISLNWTVANQAAVATIAPAWTDAIYLSTDAMWQSGTDQLLTSRQQTGPLAASASYTAIRNVTIPNGISGNYYLLLVNDPANLHNDSDRANNIAGSAISITLTPPPDLAPIDLVAPVQGFAGQPVEVAYSVKNMGTGTTAPVTSWTDRFYLSTDFTLDGSDQILENVAHTTALGVNETYSDTVQVYLPPGSAGNKILILKTDVNNGVYEFDKEDNNTAAVALLVVQPPPSDLVISSMVLPGSAIAGEEILLQWNLKNQGANPAIGYMQEAVFFSQDTVWDTGDALLGVKASYINLAPQATLLQSIMADLTGVEVGNYYAIIRTDILNNIAESNESNNTTPSASPLNVTVNELLLNVPTAATLFDNKNLYYRIEIPPAFEGETLLVTLAGDSVSGANELYLRFGQVPTRSAYDFAYSVPFYGNQEVIVPELQAGTYYLLAYGNTTAGDDQALSLLARILNFEIHSVHAGQGGNNGQVTVQINGAKFEPEMALRLERSGVNIAADTVYFISSLRVYATFNLKGAALGLYDVVAEKVSGGSAMLPDGFEVIPGTAPSLATHIIQSPSTRPNQVATIRVEYANTGTTDIVDPLVQLVSIAGAPVSLDAATVEDGDTALDLPLEEIGGPPNVLRPGATGSITIYTKATAGLGFTLLFPQL